MSNERRIYSVSELNNIARLTLEGLASEGLWLGGEIRDIKKPASGHIYFAITDGESSIDAVMWRSSVASMSFKPESGMAIEAIGKPTLYEKTGRYQFMVRRMLPVGEGARAVAFRQLKEKLEKEGLFSMEFKKKLPDYPFRIGVVTSGSGAAIRDIVNVIRRRAPYVSIYLRPAKVQGDGAAEEISEGIRELNRFGDLDLMIVGRGGGSEEDLWCFNDEGLARTIFHSETPIISAVGHEIDFSIADFVADLRAPTPSAAAELAVKDILELESTLIGYVKNARRGLFKRVDFEENRLRSIVSRSGWREPLRKIHDYEMRIDSLSNSAIAGVKLVAERSIRNLNSLSGRLSGLGVSSVLKRGFAVVESGNKPITSALELSEGDKIDLRFYDGKRSAKVTK